MPLLTPLPGAFELRVAEGVVRSRTPTSRRPAELSEAAIERLAFDLDRMSYMPRPFFAVEISKSGGGARRLALPCWRDRIVARALLDQLAPKIHPLLAPCSFAYMPRRGTRQAIAAVRPWRKDGFRWVLQLDVRDCFSSIRPWQVLKDLSRAGATAAEREIVRRFVTRPITDGNSFSPPHGLPQGLSLSPLLANLVLDPLDRAMLGRDAPYLRYGDDMLVGLRRKRDRTATENLIETLLRNLGLGLAGQKTRLLPLCRRSLWLGRALLPFRPARPESWLLA